MVVSRNSSPKMNNDSTLLTMVSVLYSLSQKRIITFKWSSTWLSKWPLFVGRPPTWRSRSGSGCRPPSSAQSWSPGLPRTRQSSQRAPFSSGRRTAWSWRRSGRWPREAFAKFDRPFCFWPRKYEDFAPISHNIRWLLTILYLSCRCFAISISISQVFSNSFIFCEINGFFCRNNWQIKTNEIL